jgi:uncharacterized protein YodC (DUF2158 family)
MRVKFLKDELYENLGRNKGYEFKEGEKYDFEPSFAERWIRRGIAEEIEGGKRADTVGTGGPFIPVGGSRPAPTLNLTGGGKPAKPAASAPEPEPEPEIETNTVTFAVGDRVRLKSGGPEMTVDLVGDDGMIVAAWANEDGTPDIGTFDPATLDPIPAADQSAEAVDAAAPKPLDPPKPGDAG